MKEKKVKVYGIAHDDNDNILGYCTKITKKYKYVKLTDVGKKYFKTKRNTIRIVNYELPVMKFPSLKELESRIT